MIGKPCLNLYFFISVQQVFQSVESQFTTTYIYSFNDSNMSHFKSNTKLKKMCHLKKRSESHQFQE